MIIITSKHNALTAIKIEPDDQMIIVEFEPEPDNVPTISFYISMIQLPNDRIAVEITLPEAYSYRRDGLQHAYVLLDDPNQSNSLSFTLRDGTPDGKVLHLDRLEAEKCQ